MKYRSLNPNYITLIGDSFDTDDGPEVSTPPLRSLLIVPDYVL
jgi:hypothetical protein